MVTALLILILLVLMALAGFLLRAVGWVLGFIGAVFGLAMLDRYLGVGFGDLVLAFLGAVTLLGLGALVAKDHEARDDRRTREQALAQGVDLGDDRPG